MINGQSGATYTACNLTANAAIKVVLTSNANCASPTTATSNVLTYVVTANVVPSVTIQSTPLSPICEGQTVSFIAIPTNGGTTPTYTWNINGAPQPNSNSSTFTTNTLANGDVVTASMTSSLSCANPTAANSNSISISIIPTVVPSVTITASPNPLCAGDSVLCIATPANGGTPTYTWNINGSDITNSNQDTIIIAPPTNGDVVTVVMESSEACASPTTATSNSITLVVNTPIAPTISQNGPVLTSSAPTNNSWYVVGNPNSIGNQQSYVVTQDGYYYVVYTDSNGCSVTTDTIHVILGSVVENSGISNLSLYPNPAQNSLTGGILQIDLKNMLGQTVYTCNSNVQPGLYKNTLELNAAPGIYSLTIRTQKGMLSRKIEIVK